jgi:serine/threonine-protein kinase
VWIALGICDELNRIHQRGAIHGDLRPDDVRVDAETQVTIVSAPGCSDARVPGRTMDSAAYISPERAQGKWGTARSDLYAVGVMLYEMLTGAVPFNGQDPFDVMSDRLVNDPVPPRVIDPEISPQMQEIIYRAMERNPKRRYATVAELAWDLTHQQDVPVMDRPALRNWRKRRSRWSRVGFDVARALGAAAALAALSYFLVPTG